MEEVITLFSCSICLQNVNEDEKCTTNCNHSFCLNCINNWFEQNTDICPLCRRRIISYDSRDGKHHIITINTNNNNNNNTNNNTNNNNNTLHIILQLRNKIYYMNFIILLSFIYFVYSIYNSNSLIVQRDYYASLYHNCTEKLLINEQLVDIIQNTNSLSTIPIYFNNHLYECFFPLYYIDKCYLGIPGQH